MSRMIAVGSWVLGKLARGPYTEAVAGDLAEGVRGGRSAGWYWRQVVCAVGMAWVRTLRERRGAAVFSVLWASLFSFWPFVGPARDIFWMAQKMTERLFGHLLSLPFPYSWMTLSLFAERINVGFVWLGVLVYLTVSRSGWQGSSAKRLGGGLMVSSGVYLLGRFAVWLVMLDMETGRGRAMGVVEANLSWLWIGFSVSVGLYCGILVASTRREHVRAVMA